MSATCKTIQDQFNDYREQSLPFNKREPFECHLTTCNDCRLALEMTREMITACNRLEEDPVPVGFEVGLRQRLEAVSPVKVSSPFEWFKNVYPAFRPAAIWGTATVALLILVTSLYYNDIVDLSPIGPSSPMVTSSPILAEPIRLDLHKDHLLRIWFNATEPIEQVRFHIELPEGISLIENGRIVPVHQIQWIGNLKEGRNVIPVPVRGIAKGQWTVTAWIEKDSIRKEKSIELWVNGIKKEVSYEKANLYQT